MKEIHLEEESVNARLCFPQKLSVFPQCPFFPCGFSLQQPLGKDVQTVRITASTMAQIHPKGTEMPYKSSELYQESGHLCEQGNWEVLTAHAYTLMCLRDPNSGALQVK